MRVGLVTSSAIFTNFMTDQIELETNRLEMVKKGTMDIHQAEKENDEWETVRTFYTHTHIHSYFFSNNLYHVY